MDPKPIPPSGNVEDLRNAPAAKTPEQLEAEKLAKRDKVRRNLRIIALCLAAYYFASAGYSWYKESQYADAVAEVNAINPLKSPQMFREAFNELINAADTSLPVATANDTPEGFVSVLSTALELKGTNKPNSTELQEVQIQTRYPDAFPPESIVGFRSFVLACEKLALPNATAEQADQLLEQVSLIPRVDANEKGKQFPNTSVRSQAYEYRTTFNAGPINELTLIAVPLANLGAGEAIPSEVTVDGAASSATADSVSTTTADTAAPADAGAAAETPAASEATTDAATAAPANSTSPEDSAAASSDVPSLNEPSSNSTGDVPSL